MSFLWCSHTWAQNIHAIRSWSDVSGRFKTKAAFVGSNDNQVQLQLSDGRVIALPKNRLSSSDREYLLAVTTLKHTANQSDHLVSQFDTDNLRGQGLQSTLLPLIEKYPEGFAAPFYETVLLPYGSKKASSLTRTQRSGRRVVDLVQRLREHWPNLHKTTLGSVYNYLAVAATREQNVAGFANFLKSSAEETSPRLLFATHHNASIIIASGNVEQKYRSALGRVLAEGSPDPGPTARQRLAYTFEHDSFALPALDSHLPADNKGSTESSDPPPAKGLTAIATGSCFLITRKHALTNAHVIKQGTALRVRNDNGDSYDATVHAVSPDPRVDLAVLRLKTPASDITPLKIAAGDPPLQTELVLLGYPKPNFFEESLTSDKGSLSKYNDQGRTLMHSASADPGNSGGPCVDNTGKVIGVLFAGSTVAANARNYAVSASATRQFLENLNLDVSFSTASTATNFADIVKRVGPSVMMVTVYGAIAPTETLDTRDRSQGKEPLILYDECCLACGGSGIATCGACVGGYNQVPYTALVTRKFSGEPITAQKFKKVACKRCRRGKVPCRACGGSGDASTGSLSVWGHVLCRVVPVAAQEMPADL